MAWRATLAGLVFGVLLLPTAAAATSLNAVRIGLHADFTRVVFDLSQSLRPSIKQIAEDRIRVRFAVPPDQAFRVAPTKGLIQRVVVDRTSGATQLDLMLRRPGEVRKAFALAPRPGTSEHRFVIDVGRRAAPSAPSPPPAASPPPPAPPPPEPVEAGSAETVVAALRTPPPVPMRRPRTADQAPEPSRPFVVVIDPGHGGRDPGATTGQRGVPEKHITLAVATQLAEILAHRDDVEVHLTRKTDVGVPLAKRMTRAVEVDADLFVSIHADSIPGQPYVSGASVYTLSTRASDADAARKAQEENAADEKLQIITEHQDETVRTILTSLMRTSTTNRSADFAALLVDELRGVTPLLNRNRRYANFVVLRSLRVPSVLVELGYLSNVTDEAALLDPGHQNRLAHAMARAIVSLAART